jgi:hypothetical protein
MCGKSIHPNILIWGHTPLDWYIHASECTNVTLVVMCPILIMTNVKIRCCLELRSMRSYHHRTAPIGVEKGTMAEPVRKVGTVEEKLARLEELERKEKKVKERYKKYGERHRATVAIILAKAKAQGIKVTPAEIDKYLAENK